MFFKLPQFKSIVLLLCIVTSSFAVAQNGIMSVTGNGNPITNPGGAPLASNNTDYGNVSVGSPIPHTFNIANTAGGGSGTNLENVTITITGSTAFTPIGPTNIGQIKKATSKNHIITFTPAAIGPYIATVTITASTGGTNVPYVFTIQGNGVTPQPEIDIQGNGASIVDGDPTPDLGDDTDFGDADVTVGTVTHTFTIFNTGALGLNLTGTGPEYVAITGTHAGDFSVTANPTTPVTSGGGLTTFNITFDPSGTGIRTARLTILNNDGDESGYFFDIQGNGTIVTSGSQNINVRGNTIDIPDNDITPIVADNTDFGDSNVGFSIINTFEIQNTHSGGSTSSNILTIASITVSGVNAADFTVTSSITTLQRGTSDTFTITFNPGALGLRTATVTVASNSSVGSEQPYTFDIWGTGTAPSPEINVVDDTDDIISDGSIDSPATINNTAFGSTDSLSPISNTFTIENNGGATLNISSLTSDNPDFAITLAPASSITSSGTTTFTITFTPSGVGIISAIITIINDDSAPEDVYTFTVQGEGTAAPPEYTAYYENFDASNGGWTIITSTGDTWLWTNSFPVSAIELNEGGFWRNSAYDNYLDNTNIIVESPSLDLTGLQNIKISLDVKYKTENGNDGMRIMYSISGGAYTLLGASGSGTNWYEDNVTALGSDGWNENSHPVNTSFTHSKFVNASLNVSDATFSNQSDVKFRIEFSTNGSSIDEGVAFDNFRIHADPMSPLNDATVGPADITSNLRLWLKANEGIAGSDGTALTNWEDQAYDTTLDKEDASAASTLAPTYRDSGSRNMNYNAVLDFDNNNVEYMNGKGGFYSTDYFAVFRSDDVVATQTGSFSPGRQFAVGSRYSDDNFHEDPSGLGMGSSTARYSDEILAHNINSFPTGTAAPNDNSYGRSYTTTTDTFQNHVLIVNVKSNASRTGTEIYKNGKRIDNTTGKAGNGVDLNFKEFYNTPFLIGTGRSGIAGRTTSQLNGMLTEIVSYSSPNSAINQQKIQSYLGIKYGVTLQDASSTLLDHRLNDVDYIDSQGKTIWDTAVNTGYNYDVAGIGRDDQSLLDQRQSKSQNDEADGIGPTSGFLSMSLTDTYNTNKENIAATTSLNDREFLVWGNNNADLGDPAVTIEVDMSEDIGGALITNVSFESMTRVWKVVETGSGALGTFDVPSVEVSIPTNVVRTATPPDGRYLMFISATGIFDPTADYRVMRESGGMLYADYDFDNTEYITFGWAPEKEFKRSIYFDPISNPAKKHYIDMEDALDINPDGNGFTVSAWVNRAASSNNTSILSKRNAPFTEGYDLKINNDGKAEMTWFNGGAQTITSDVEIPENEWHQIAVIYSGSTATMYIDGVWDAEENLTAPSTTGTSHSFFVAAAVKGTPEAHFHGNIDEVRVWDIALSLDQLKYIMNQEIEENSTFVGGKIIPNTITKNEVGVIDWGKLAGYYPMSIYTYTNTKDASGNGHQGALKNLQTVDWQTAPLPYISQQDGDWNLNTSWENGDKQTIPGSNSIADNTKTIDWNIVETTHDITMDNSLLPISSLGADNRTVLGLIVKSGELTIDGNTGLGIGNGLTVTHYLKLDGVIDLQGESQLIQTDGSDLATSSAGNIEKDQQGTANSFTYNYWSSPVSSIGVGTNNNSFNVEDVLFDGTIPDDTTRNITFGGINNPYHSDVPALPGAPIKITSYWLWKFVNSGNDYANWEWIGNNGTPLNVAEGFTMKGVSGSASIVTDQNYVFIGKPNNVLNGASQIVHTQFTSPQADTSNPEVTLTGNPFPSALDADQFITDNTLSTSGPLYFWEHWGGGTHQWQQYQGGYALRVFGMGNAATSHPDADQTGDGLKGAPGQYVPVGQGFYVISSDAGGDVVFNNAQRQFVKEGTSSVFFKQNDENTVNQSDDSDTMIIGLGFKSSEGFYRPVSIGFGIVGATDGFDKGYDGPAGEFLSNDALLMHDDKYYVIQSMGEFSEDKEIPLVVFVDEANNKATQTFMIDRLVNVPDELEIYIRDNVSGETYDIRDQSHEFSLETGEYKTKYSVVFQPRLLRSDEISEIEEGFLIYMNNNLSEINIKKIADIDVTKAVLVNSLGQTINIWSNKLDSRYIALPVNVSTGVYILSVETKKGTITKKLLIE